MKYLRLPVVIVFIIGLVIMVSATPSTEFWTAGTTDIQPFGIGHFDIDNYFTVFRKAVHGAGAFPTDVGYTIGVLPFSKLQMEAGIDLVEPQDNSIFFNAKLGVPEDAFFKGQPAVAGGIFEVGTEAEVTDFDIIYVNIGKTIPILGRFFVGGYIGNKPAMGSTANKGITVAWDRSFLPAKSATGVDYYRFLICADVATGDNIYSAAGAGIAYFFNENISVLIGPVFFTNIDLNGQWKWSTQLDINFKNW